jgi:glycosyltransferase involved in cell wall biosynthesis
VGLGINQAFYWGLPMVTEEGKQPPEIGYLKHGYNGFMVPENDLAALREQIVFLADNDEVRTRFSACARKDIHAHGSIEGMFQGFLQAAEYLTEAPALNRAGR